MAKPTKASQRPAKAKAKASAKAGKPRQTQAHKQQLVNKLAVGIRQQRGPKALQRLRRNAAATASDQDAAVGGGLGLDDFGSEPDDQGPQIDSNTGVSDEEGGSDGVSPEPKRREPDMQLPYGMSIVQWLQLPEGERMKMLEMQHEVRQLAACTRQRAHNHVARLIQLFWVDL